MSPASLKTLEAASLAAILYREIGQCQSMQISFVATPSSAVISEAEMSQATMKETREEVDGELAHARLAGDLFLRFPGG